MSSADGRVQRGECRLLKADGRVPGADDGDGDGDGDVDGDGDGDCDGDGEGRAPSAACQVPMAECREGSTDC